LLVSLAVLGVLAAITIPAVQQARESSRRTLCANNARQIGLACAEFESVNGRFPKGWGPAGASFLVQVLPYLDQMALYDKFDFDAENPFQFNTEVAATRVPVLLCPSDPGESVERVNGLAATSYAGNYGAGVQTYGYNGMFQHLRGLQAGSITDGLSNTALASEILISAGLSFPDELRGLWVTPYELSGPDELDDFIALCEGLDTATATVGYLGRGRPWTLGGAGFSLYNHVLAPNRRSCLNFQLLPEGIHTAASYHPGGVHVILADGHLSLVSEGVDEQVWLALASRNGAESP
jgi:hypothetical protein